MPRWFGPKVTGYGTGPQSWQGWLVSALAAALVISVGVFDVRTLGLPEWSKVAAITVIVTAFLPLVWATYSEE